MRVGILTGGGDCASLNAAVRGVAKPLMIHHGAEIIGIEDGFLGLIERRVRPLKLEDFEGLIREGGTFLGTSNKAMPRSHHGVDVTADVVEYYRALRLDCIVAIGGDGTMSMCHGLANTGMRFIGIPKTIDNDLMQTDRTFGFDTAVNVVSEALDRLHTTGRSHRRVMIVETMGRYAGWIALHGGVAGDADVILIPEYAYDIDYVAEVIRRRARSAHYSVVVVAEGAMPLKGQVTVSKIVADSPDPVRLGGIGHVLQAELEKRLDMEIRTTVLGHTQRGGPPTSFDRIFATDLGCYAAKMFLRQEFDRMVTVKNNTLTSVSLANVADQTRHVTELDMTFISAIMSGVSFGNKDVEQRVLNQPGDVAQLC